MRTAVSISMDIELLNVLYGIAKEEKIPLSTLIEDLLREILIQKGKLTVKG